MPLSVRRGKVWSSDDFAKALDVLSRDLCSAGDHFTLWKELNKALKVINLLSKLKGVAPDLSSDASAIRLGIVGPPMSPAETRRPWKTIFSCSTVGPVHHGLRPTTSRSLFCPGVSRSAVCRHDQCTISCTNAVGWGHELPCTRRCCLVVTDVLRPWTTRGSRTSGRPFALRSRTGAVGF